MQALCYAPSSKSLLSAANDTSLMLWDFTADRKESPKWATSDSCMKCDKPFFWNVKQMWNEKTMGLRQVSGGQSLVYIERQVVVQLPVYIKGALTSFGFCLKQ